MDNKIEKLWKQLGDYDMEVKRTKKILYDLEADKKILERKARTTQLIKIGATVVATVKKKYSKDLLGYDVKDFPTVLEIVKHLKF